MIKLNHSKAFYTSFVFLVLIILICHQSSFSKEKSLTKRKVDLVEKGEIFSLKVGDILIRPNKNWLPGSSEIDSGRKFGHAGIVVEGAEGSTIQEVLSKSQIIEAFVFDQATRKYVFDRERQVRKAPSIISFSNRFEGIRYRLRINLTEDQRQKIIRLLENQIGVGGYNLFSLRSQVMNYSAKSKNNPDLIFRHWNCATFVWFAYYQALGVDLDSNGGAIIFPNDLINSPVFDQSDGRCRF